MCFHDHHTLGGANVKQSNSLHSREKERTPNKLTLTTLNHNKNFLKYEPKVLTSPGTWDKKLCTSLFSFRATEFKKN